MLSISCVFDTPPVWQCLLSDSVRPNEILRNLIASASFNRNGSIFESATMDSILDMYEAVSQLDHLTHADAASIDGDVKRALSLTQQKDSVDPITTHQRHLNTAGRINACCRLCSMIFWKLLECRTQLEAGRPAIAMEEAILLMEALTKVEPSYWARNAPEVLTWIVFTGAAVSIDGKERGAFLLFGGTVLMAIDSESLTLIRQGWRYFCLLRRLGGLSLHSDAK